MIAWELFLGFAKKVFGLMPLKDWLIVGLLAVGVIYHLYTVHEARVSGREEGAQAAQQKCTAEKKVAQAEYDRRVKEAEDKNRATEQQQATELAIAGANYEKDLQDSKDQRDRDVAAARSGALRLRVAGMCPNPSGDRAAPQASASPARGDGAEGAELPAETTRRLFELADDADAVTKQLSACQAIVNIDRKGQS